jgi:hypothetical protein
MIIYEFSKLLDLSQKELRIFLHRSPQKELSIHNHALGLPVKSLVYDKAPGKILGLTMRPLAMAGGASAAILARPGKRWGRARAHLGLIDGQRRAGTTSATAHGGTG